MYAWGARMNDVKSYLRSLERSRESLTRADRPEVFVLAGREWDLLDGVFAPSFSSTTEAAMGILGLTGADGLDLVPSESFLEVGSGTGVIAVAVALAGCARVVATDISVAAVRNTELNAARHGVADRVRVVRSDLFSGLGKEDLFDSVYWHSNFVLAPEDYDYRDEHERAYVDPGYAAHERYLIEAPLRVTEGGRALLQFSSRGDLDRLHELARRHGRDLTVLAKHAFRDGEADLEHILLEIRVMG
jgi:release factor glutamine methyltransferase